MASVDDDVHDRQKRVEGWAQDKVSASKCLVAGAGALGNEVVKLLLQLGVKEIVVVDYDSVVKANLNRCVFFTEKDAEENAFKAKVIAREAKRVYPEASVTPELRALEELPESFYKKFGYGFGCLDNLGARMHLNAQLYGNAPLVDGGTTGFFGKVQVVQAPSSCIECGLSARDYKLLWKKYSCVGDVLDFLDPKMPALPTTTSLIAAMQVNEFVKLAHGRENHLAGKYVFFDGLKNEETVFEVPKRKECPVHL